jgi:hypothetical protein
MARVIVEGDVGADKTQLLHWFDRARAFERQPEVVRVERQPSLLGGRRITRGRQGQLAMVPVSPRLRRGR